MKRFFKVLFMTLLLALVALAIRNYVTTQNGPFAFFREMKPDYSTSQVAEFGTVEINKKIANGITGTELDKFLVGTGFQCTKRTNNFPSYLGLTREIKSYNWCDYWYGLFRGHTIRVTYITEKDDSLSKAKSLIACPPCTGV
jgi:hypothetical protein